MAAVPSMLTAPTGLICQLLARPDKTLIHMPHPTLGWVVNDTAPDSWQTAWHIQATSDLKQWGPGTWWDSGRVESAESVNVRYAGTPLPANSTVYWRVRVWNQRGEVSPWSEAQTVHTGDFAATGETERYPLEQTANPPVERVQKARGHWFLAFERAAFATLRFTMTAPAAGGKITLHLGEALEAPQTVERNPPGHIRYRCLKLSLRPGTRTYTVEIPPDERNTGPWAIKMPPAIGEVLPFRYVEIEDAPGAPDHPVQLMAHYPFDDSAAAFCSSDPTLNAIWDLCHYTIKATSFCGVYVDGDRERIPYEGDAYINQLGHYGVDREFTLARHTHEFLIRTPTWPTEWILHSVLMAWADYDHTGNLDSVRRHYADLKAKTLHGLAREDGLISTEKGRVTPELYRSIHLDRHELVDLVDWPAAGAEAAFGQFLSETGERDGFEMRPVNTVINAFHYRALVLMARIAAALGQLDEAETFRLRAQRVLASFNACFFDSARCIYVDGVGTDHASLHANLFALTFELVPAEHRPSVIAFIKSRGMACSVYGAQHLLDGLYANGEAEYALSLLTARHDRSWWNMIAVGSTMALEAWDWKYKQNLDWNHAWGAAPANLIPRYLLGVRPLEPGFARILIQPQPAHLPQASGVVPTIRGPVKVAFEHEADIRFLLEVELPANTRGVVKLPLGGTAARLLVDDREVPGVPEGRSMAIEIGSGAHRIELLGGNMTG